MSHGIYTNGINLAFIHRFDTNEYNGYPLYADHVRARANKSTSVNTRAKTLPPTDCDTEVWLVPKVFYTDAWPVSKECNCSNFEGFPSLKVKQVYIARIT